MNRIDYLNDKLHLIRRRSAQDELLMRGYLIEGDIVVAEVQSLFSDGSLSLHPRNLKVIIGTPFFVFSRRLIFFSWIIGISAI